MDPIASIERVLGGIYLDRLRRFDLALDHYREGQRIYQMIDSPHSEADVWYQIGLVFLGDGKEQQARQSWEIALTIARNVSYNYMIDLAQEQLADDRARSEQEDTTTESG